MSLERMWAGWRNEYVSDVAGDEKPDCVFCSLSATSDDKGAYVLDRNDLVFVALNAYPYSSGHVMVSPHRHVGEIEELTVDESTAVWSALDRSVRAIKAAYHPHGINVGINIGRVAGAGYPGHVHVHAVPRWNGDTNFMTSVAETRVMPESLSSSYEKLTAAWPG